MHFKTIFDLTEEKSVPLKGYRPLLYLVIIIVGVIILYNRTVPRLEAANEKIVAIGFSLLFLYFMSLFLIGQFSTRRQIRQIMQAKAYFVVEGTPQNYHPMPKQDTTLSDMTWVVSVLNIRTWLVLLLPQIIIDWHTTDGSDSNRILKIEVRQWGVRTYCRLTAPNMLLAARLAGRRRNRP